MSWILSGYTIVIAAGMVGAGRWHDRLGRRRVFLGGIGLFTVASAICAVAPDAGVLVAARVLQGFGAAALTPASLGLILRAFPTSRVPQAIALWGAAGALAAALGPTVGGLFVEAWGWRSVFVVNVPIGIAIAIVGPWLLDESREPEGAPLPDSVGTGVVTSAVVLLALGIVQSSEWGWSNARTIGALLTGLLLLGAFVVRCAAVANPGCSRSISSPSAGFVGNARQAALRHGVHDHVLRKRPVPPRGLGVFAGLDGPRNGARPTRRIPPRASVRETLGRIGQRSILVPGGIVYALAALFLLSRADSAPRYLTVAGLPFALSSGVGVSMVFPQLTSAAIVGLPCRPLRHGVGRQRRDSRAGSDARRGDVRGGRRTRGAGRAYWRIIGSPGRSWRWPLVEP